MTRKAANKPRALVFELGWPGIADSIDPKAPFRRRGQTVALAYDEAYESQDRVYQLCREKALAPAAASRCEKAFDDFIEKMGPIILERLGVDEDTSIVRGFHNDGTLEKITAAFEKCGFKVVPFTLDPLPKDPRVAKALDGVGDTKRRYKAAAQLVQAAEQKPALAGEMVTALLQASTSKSSRIVAEHRASAKRVREALKGGWNLSNIGIAHYLVDLGAVVAGPGGAMGASAKAALEGRSDALAASFAEASASWTDEMLEVFLQAVVLRPHTGSALKAADLKKRPAALAVLATLPRGTGGPGQKLLESLIGRGRPARAIPKKLPTDIREALALLGTVSPKDLPRRRPATGAVSKLPADLAALYTLHDGLEGTAVQIAAAGKLASLKKDFAHWVKSALEEAEPAPRRSKGLDLRKVPLDRLLPFANLGGSASFLVIDTKEPGLPVYSFDHEEEQGLCHPYRASIGAVVSAIALEAVARKDPGNAQLERLLQV